jgi:hypothetical protein
MHYADGTDIHEGDLVTYDMEPAVVEEVINTPEKLQAWGLEEPGVMLKCEAFGRVFEQLGGDMWDVISFVRRG